MSTEGNKQSKKLFQSALSDFAAASVLGKFAVIADIATVLGISLTTIITLPLISRIIGRSFSILDFLLMLLFLIIGLAISLSSLGSIAQEAITLKRGGSINGAITLGVSFMAVLCGYIWIAPKAAYAVGYVFNISYILPDPAEKAVIEVLDLSVAHPYKSKDKVLIQGKIKFSEGSSPSNYRIGIYGRIGNNVQLQYISANESHAPISTEIADDGEFEMHGISTTGIDETTEMFLLVARNSDKPMFNNYPASFISHKDAAIHRLQAYVQPFNPKTYLFN